MLSSVYFLTAAIFILFQCNIFCGPNSFTFSSDIYSPSTKIKKTLLLIFSIGIRMVFILIVGKNIFHLVNCAVDFLMAYLIYIITLDFYQDSSKSFSYMLLYLLNPIVLIYSCTQNLFFSPYLMLILLIGWCMYQKKWASAYTLFIIGVAFSLQTLILLPVFLLTLWEYLKKERGIRMNTSTLIIFGSTLALIGFFLLLPDLLLDHLHKASSYPYVSSNLCNLWSMLGKNWADFSDSFLVIPYNIWTILMGIIILSLFLYFNRKWQDKSLRPILNGFLLLLATYVLQLGVLRNFFVFVLGMAFVLVLFTETKTFYKIYLCLTSLHFVLTLSIPIPLKTYCV